MEVFVEAIHEEVIQKDMVGFGARREIRDEEDNGDKRQGMQDGVELLSRARDTRIEGVRFFYFSVGPALFTSDLNTLCLAT